MKDITSINFRPEIYSGVVPTVLRPSGNGERAFDLFSALVADARIIFVTGVVTSEMAEVVNATMLHLENLDDNKPINMYIDSPGGSVTAGLAMYNIMRTRRCPVYTLVVGQASSMGAFLLSAGAPGHRAAMKYARIMIHQPLGGGGEREQASMIEIYAKEIIKTKALLNELLAKHTGQSVTKVEQDTDRDNFMSADEALAYGLIDKVIDVP